MVGAFLTGISTEELAEQIARIVLERISETNEFTSSPEQSKLLTRAEVAKMCNVKSLSTLWYWQKQKLLVPTSRAGRKPLYRYEDVISFLNVRKEGNDDK